MYCEQLNFQMGYLSLSSEKEKSAHDATLTKLTSRGIL